MKLVSFSFPSLIKSVLVNEQNQRRRAQQSLRRLLRRLSGAIWHYRGFSTLCSQVSVCIIDCHKKGSTFFAAIFLAFCRYCVMRVLPLNSRRGGTSSPIAYREDAVCLGSVFDVHLAQDALMSRSSSSFPCWWAFISPETFVTFSLRPHTELSDQCLVPSPSQQ